MPNGSAYSPEEYETLDAFVQPVDGAIADFARQIGGSVVHGYHGMPDRRIMFPNADNLVAMIDIAPRFYKDDPSRGPRCLVDASVIEIDKYFHKLVAELSEVPASKNEFIKVLEEAYDTIQRVKEKDLRMREE